jgi:peptidyl-prolyl cis-trans isomerase D
VQVEVNGQAISKQAFELNYRRARQMRDPSLMTAASETQLKNQIINEMVINDVSMQSARSYGFEVNVAQANQAILSIPQFQQDGHFSSDRYQQTLNGALFTPESFQKEVRQGMLLNQQRFVFMGTAFALPSEIKQFVQLYLQTRDYNYLQIPMSKFSNETSSTAQEINAYYQQHQREFLTPEKVSIQYVRLSLPDIKKTLKVSDALVKAYYQENQVNYTTPAQWKVAHILLAVPADISPVDEQRIRQRADDLYAVLIKSPGQFESNVKIMSDDKISAAKGGVLPWIIAGQSEYDKGLVNIDTKGQISKPIKSQNGYEIFKLIAYKPSSIKPLNEVSDQIKDQLLSDLAQENYTKTLEKLADLSYQTPDTLTGVAKAIKLPILESAPFSRQGERIGVLETKQVVNAAFSHDVLELGNNSEPIALDNESVVVLRINQRFPAVEKSLSEVRDTIQKKLTKVKAKAMARALGKEILDTNLDALKQDKLIKASDLQWKSVPVAGRDTGSSLLVINEMAFKLPRVGAEMGRSLPNGDYVIVHLNKINDGNSTVLDKEQLFSIKQQIEANYGMLDYDLYVRHLMSAAKIIRY